MGLGRVVFISTVIWTSRREDCSRTLTLNVRAHAPSSMFPGEVGIRRTNMTRHYFAGRML